MNKTKRVLLSGATFGLISIPVGLFIGLQVSTTFGMILVWPLGLLFILTGVPIGMWSGGGWIVLVVVSVFGWAGLFWFVRLLLQRIIPVAGEQTGESMSDSRVP